jgi:hypothetical protein
MMSFYSVLIVECDCDTDSEFCWGELVLKIEEDETKAMGIKGLEEWGWDLTDPDFHVCPYCSKGVKKDDVLTPMIRRVK